MGQSGRGLRAGAKSDDGTDDDVKRQVDSGADSKNQKQIYRLVNVKNGGGKLIEIIKSSAASAASGSGSFTRQTSLGIGIGESLASSEVSGHFSSPNFNFHRAVFFLAPERKKTNVYDDAPLRLTNRSTTW